VAWPAWFAGADFLLAVAALVLAFLAASFVARNSDVWLHLAAGKRLLAGEYTPGSDPFSYSGADRPWVNHSLLYDVGTYLLFGDAGTGAALVVAKALFVAAAFALVVAVRRPGYPLWPWAAVAAVAVVAAAPYLSLRPTVGSMFLLALTLFLLFRVPQVPGSWRFPVAFGVVCWVWANVDEWFFLGPLTVALVLVGELVQRKVLGGEAATGTAPEDPLGPPADVPTLAKALGIGLLACMLNPNHVRVWELPFELVGSKDVAADPRFKQLVALSPLDRFYTNTEVWGNNQNGLAFAVLFVGGGAALGLAGGRVRVAHVALWLGFALLSLQSVHAIPFLALVAVPVIAGRLNAMSAPLALGTWNEPKTRLLLFGSAGGRVLCLGAVVAACVLAWPGWIHPQSGNAASDRRVAWGVEAEPGMVRGARQLQAWREAGRLPAEARGVNASLEFGNYCTWFAPLEKVFVDGRYNFHRPEWRDYVSVRAGLRLIEQDEPDPREPGETLRKVGAEYVALHAGPGDSPTLRLLARQVAVTQWLDWDHWSPWYFDGRNTINGWRPDRRSGKPTFEGLRVEPVVLAFGPGAERLPPGTTQPVRPVGGWEEAFIRSPGFPPPGVDEALTWRLYGEVASELQRSREQIAGVWAASWVAPGGLSWQQMLRDVVTYLTPPGRSRPAQDVGPSAAFLALRAARRAIADDPNHPDAYFALFRALGDPNLPLADTDRAIGRITALRQCLERMPAPGNYKPGVYLASPTEAAVQLALLYAGRRQQYQNVPAGIPVNERGLSLILRDRFLATSELVTDGKGITRVPTAALRQLPVQVIEGPFLVPLDVIRDTFEKAQKYAEVEITDPANREKAVAELKAEQKAFDREYATNNNTYQAQRAGKKLPEQVRLALQKNLAGEALRLLTTESPGDLGAEALDFHLCRVALELALGRLEDAADDLRLLGSDPAVQQRMNGLQSLVFNSLQYQKCLLEGNYADAGRLMEQMSGAQLGEDPTREDRAQFNPKPFVENKKAVLGWNVAALSALLAPNPWDLAARSFAPEAELVGYAAQVSPTEVRSFPGFLTLQSRLAQHRAVQADFFVRRGVLFVYEGDIPAAEQRFLQTRLPAVQEWGLPAFRSPVAERYLAMFADARRLAATPGK
jgi:hypothetical protein